jgi:hypothetical protein
MRLFGESVNIMSMGGLAVAIQLVIDDAVVVVENCPPPVAWERGRGGRPPSWSRPWSAPRSPSSSSRRWDW